MKTSRKLLALLLGISLLLGMFGCAPKAEEPETPALSPNVGTGSTVPMKAGTYSKEVTGMTNGLVVETTVGETLIEKVEVISHNETAGISDPAIEQIPAKIVELQSIKVDVVSGATRTSEGIIAAVSAALEEAGAKLEDFSVESGVATVAAAAWPVMGSFEVPAAWDESYDVVVVGSGFAGLAAAYSAKTAGADTVLIEKQAMTGGNSATNGGQYAAYTSKIAAQLQTELGLEPDTAAKHIEDTMKGGDYMSDLPLVENMVYGAPYFFDLLLDNGLEVRNVLARPGGHYGYRTYVTVNQ
ncbi:MAG TPA: FAD-dependent oxidoreductase, partial [Terriglobales bacterium]|nr:FAD-dependent oxidoreductase [Terriglobales bacterium]